MNKYLKYSLIVLGALFLVYIISKLFAKNEDTPPFSGSAASTPNVTAPKPQTVNEPKPQTQTAPQTAPKSQVVYADKVGGAKIYDSNTDEIYTAQNGVYLGSYIKTSNTGFVEFLTASGEKRKVYKTSARIVELN